MSVRDQIIDHAFHLFFQNGFHAVGVDAIANGAGVTRQTLYNHFESKDELVLEVIRRRDESWQRELKEQISIRGGKDPVNQLRSVPAFLNDWFQEKAFNGCLLVSAAAEFPNAHDPAHKTARSNLIAIRSIIADIATSAGMDSPNSFASQFIIVIQGAIMTEVIVRDGGDDRNGNGKAVVELANLVINQHLPR